MIDFTNNLQKAAKTVQHISVRIGFSIFQFLLAKEHLFAANAIYQLLQWNHKEFTNTCTSDNFLTILMFYCQQHPTFLSRLGSSDLESTLKARISLINKSNITEGKSFMLKKAH